MSRHPRLLLVALVVAATASLAPLPLPTPASAPASAYVQGDEPVDDIVAAASRHLCGTLNANQLAAMAMAVTFPETGAGPSSPPSPMTFGRSDTGFDLFPPNTPRDPDKHQPYWHPGVGMFQMDTSGLGANNDAAWAINVGSSAEGAAATMASRYCSSTATQADDKRAWAWKPWFACLPDDDGRKRCEDAYQAIYQGSSLAITRDANVTSNGGMQQRTCSRGGASFPCWYVNPALAQGNVNWRIPGYGPSPVTDPFYVFTNTNGSEERHWIEGGNDIKAVRPLGADARSATSWGASDITASSTPPVLALPPQAPLSAGRDYNGDGHGDVLWIGSDDGVAESLWWGLTNPGSFSNGAINAGVNGEGLPVAGDFNDDGRTDFIWYRPGAGAEKMWFNWSANREFLPIDIKDEVGATRGVNGRYTPAVGDFNGDGQSDIFWYGVEGATESTWYGREDGTFRTDQPAPQIARSGLVPIVGDYDGDDQDDIFFYGRGADAEALWQGLSSVGAQFANIASPPSVGGAAYQPLAGDFSGDGRDDIFWYQPGGSNDARWTSYGTIGDFANNTAQDVSGSYVPVGGDFNGDTIDDIFWYGEGSASDAVWYWHSNGSVTNRPKAVNGRYQPT